MQHYFSVHAAAGGLSSTLKAALGSPRTRSRGVGAAPLTAAAAAASASAANEKSQGDEGLDEMDEKSHGEADVRLRLAFGACAVSGRCSCSSRLHESRPVSVALKSYNRFLDIDLLS